MIAPQLAIQEAWSLIQIWKHWQSFGELLPSCQSLEPIEVGLTIPAKSPLNNRVSKSAVVAIGYGSFQMIFRVFSTSVFQHHVSKTWKGSTLTLSVGSFVCQKLYAKGVVQRLIDRLIVNGCLHCAHIMTKISLRIA